MPAATDPIEEATEHAAARPGEPEMVPCGTGEPEREVAGHAFRTVVGA